MATSDLTLAHMAQAAQRSESTIYRWLSSVEPPRLDESIVIWRLADRTRTAGRYLFTGEGGPFQRPGMTEQESTMLDLFRALPAEERAQVHANISARYRRRTTHDR